jgi:hypothetical protein
VATGRGNTLGEALVNAFRAAGWQSGRSVKGWHARLSALTKTARGQDALVSAGATPGDRARNWRLWLAQDRAPSKANRAAIERAYMAYRMPVDVRTKTAAITGEIVTEGNRPRNRGIDEAALRIDHRGHDSPARHAERWARLEAKWIAAVESGDYDDFEDAYYDDVIDEDLSLSEFSTGGGGYSVAIT